MIQTVVSVLRSCFSASTPDGGCSVRLGGGTAGHYWYAGSGWQDRTQKLYDLAGEVAKKTQVAPAVGSR